MFDRVVLGVVLGGLMDSSWVAGCVSIVDIGDGDGCYRN